MTKKKNKKFSESKVINQPNNQAQKFISSTKNFTRCGKKWHKIFIAIFLFLAIPFIATLTFEKIFEERIYPGIKVGELILGGKTKEEALDTLEKTTQFFREEGLVFSYQEKKVFIPSIVTAASDPDLSRLLFTLDNQQTVAEAFALGRNDKFLNNLKNQLKFLFYGKKIQLKYHLNESEFENILKENFGSFEKPAKNAKLQITTDTEGKTTIEVLPEKNGNVFDYQTAIETAFQNVADLKNEPVPLNFISEKPKIKKEDTILAKERAKKLAEFCQITLKESEKTWTISQNQFKDWLEFQITTDGVTIGFNKEKVKEYLSTIAKDINVAPQNAKFQIENGIVKEFKIHQGGKELDLDASYTTINNFILNLDEAKISTSCQQNKDAREGIDLIVKIIAPQIPIGSINNLGIKELVGRGVSNFAGSPVNRRHNIRVGATKLNGILIAPGEEFSTNKALGEINGATGYLPELVIKGDKTIPEYGGGLCQIGTTMFRVALDAGLPITERKPHSYRVVYYEPAGMDATIYSPKPDLKFINDTPAYLLLQTKINGDELIFELWGTSDGRKVEITKPKIYNLVSPGPTKIIETDDLPPGEKKCTERAHTGADAEFSRTITFANGESKTEVWKSHYVPWSAVCLIGKTPAPPSEEAPPASETSSEITSPPTNTNTDSPAF